MQQQRMTHSCFVADCYKWAVFDNTWQLVRDLFCSFCLFVFQRACLLVLTVTIFLTDSHQELSVDTVIQLFLWQYLLNIPYVFYLRLRYTASYSVLLCSWPMSVILFQFAFCQDFNLLNYAYPCTLHGQSVSKKCRDLLVLELHYGLQNHAYNYLPQREAYRYYL